MAISLPTVNSAAGADTYQNLFDKVNAIINTVANSVVTANTNANGATTTGNAFVVGILGANTLVATSITGGNVQAAANLAITTNTTFSGAWVGLGSVVNVTSTGIAIGSNLSISTSKFGLGNSTVNLSINSTSLSFSPASVLTGTSLTFGNSTVNSTSNASGFFINSVALLTSAQRDQVYLNGVLVGTASHVNFINAGSTSITATVDAGNNAVNVVIAAQLVLSNGAGGSNTCILFNDSTQIGGNGGFTYDKSVNNVFIANTLTIGTTVVNSTIFFTGNSTANAVGNTSVDIFSNSSMISSYGLGGWNVGANVFANASHVYAGNSTVFSYVNSTFLVTGSVLYTANLSGGNVLFTPSGFTIGNTTVNVAANSSTITFGSGVSVNGSAIGIGGNYTVNSSFFLFGNTTVSWSGNSTQVQVANSTIPTIISSNGVTVGANVVLGFSSLGLGNSTVNTFVNSTSISSILYTGAGIASATDYWANNSTQVLSVGALNNAGAYQTLTDAASIAFTMANGINFSVTLGGNRTLANPSIVVPGRSGVIQITQPATGNCTLSFGNQYFFDSDVAPSISTANNKSSFLFYHAFATNAILVTMAARAV